MPIYYEDAMYCCAIFFHVNYSKVLSFFNHKETNLPNAHFTLKQTRLNELFVVILIKKTYNVYVFLFINVKFSYKETRIYFSIWTTAFLFTDYFSNSYICFINLKFILKYILPNLNVWNKFKNKFSLFKIL